MAKQATKTNARPTAGRVLRDVRPVNQPAAAGGSVQIPVKQPVTVTTTRSPDGRTLTRTFGTVYGEKSDSPKAYRTTLTIVCPEPIPASAVPLFTRQAVVEWQAYARPLGAEPEKFLAAPTTVNLLVDGTLELPRKRKPADPIKTEARRKADRVRALLIAAAELRAAGMHDAANAMEQRANS